MYNKEQITEIINLFSRLEKIDKQALSNLKKLVAMAETNPIKYNLALKFL